MIRSNSHKWMLLLASGVLLAAASAGAQGAAHAAKQSKPPSKGAARML